MKVLHIFPDLPDKKCGGAVVCRRNHGSLCHYYGKENVLSFPISRKRSPSSLIGVMNDILALGFGGLTLKDKCIMVELIKKNHVGLVFIDSSLFGALSQYLKEKTNVRTIVYFHNVEYDNMKGVVKAKKNILYTYRILLAYINEKRAITNSDVIVTINKKDSNRLQALYGRNADTVVPVTFKAVDLCDNISLKYSSPLKILFLGSNFPPNVEAADILVNKILPNIKAKLIIAGSGMDTLQERYPKTDNLEIQGFVEDIEALYSSCDIVVMPIVSGAGMKVKTAEALMYGKNIMATSNALEGYDVVGVSGVIRCDTVEDFISQINNFDYRLPRFNEEARNLFLKYYSFEASNRVFKKVYDNFIEVRE